MLPVVPCRLQPTPATPPPPPPGPGRSAAGKPGDDERPPHGEVSAAEVRREVAGPRANNYGVRSNTPDDAPSRRVDKIGLDTLAIMVEENGAASLCRCYRSSTFPWCDRSHVKHNAECGDNAGPIVVKKVEPAAL
jgi:CDGSH-type Zn-finger protein